MFTQVKHVNAIGCVLFNHACRWFCGLGINHVGLNRVKVDGEHWEVVHHHRNAASPLMVFAHSVNMMVKSIQARRRKHARLSPSTTEHFAPAVGLGDERRRTDQH